MRIYALGLMESSNFPCGQTPLKHRSTIWLAFQSFNPTACFAFLCLPVFHARRAMPGRSAHVGASGKVWIQWIPAPELKRLGAAAAVISTRETLSWRLRKMAVGSTELRAK